MSAWYDSRVLNANDSDEQRFEFDNGDVEIVTTGEVRKAFHNYLDVMMFLSDWDNNIFTVSYNDYCNLPATLVDARRIYQRMRPNNGEHKT